jgi:alkylated DNA repair dioxygenase AlkB
MPGDQTTLVSPPSSPPLPEGMAYHPDVISTDEESRLLAEIRTLPFKEFQFHEFKGKRRVVSFGWRYDFREHKAFPADPIPTFLRDVCQKVQAASGFALPDLEQVLVTEYAPGAPIGWHKDRPVFGNVIGLSLVSPCTFRLRKPDGDGHWRRVSLRLEPRSAYFLSGCARWTWEHSIPPVETLRYSITFRNRRSADRGGDAGPEREATPVPRIIRMLGGKTIHARDDRPFEN